MQSAGAVRIAAVNTAAAVAGIRSDMALAQARAMQPALAIAEHDPAADAALLARIADWADRYTPLVGRVSFIHDTLRRENAPDRMSHSPRNLLRRENAPDRMSQPPDGLLLDITGAAHLQGGEAPLLADLVARLRRQGFTARAAVASTPGAAHALARFGRHGTIAAAADLYRLLAPLPAVALRIGDEMAATLRRVGLKTIGDLASRPRAPLAARFGPLLLQRLDQALGIDAEAIAPRQPIAPAIVDLPLAEPIFREEDVSEAIHHLLTRLASLLEERGEGARALELSLYRVDGDVSRLAIRSVTPSRDVALLQRLFALRLQSLADPLDAGFGFDHVRLAATAVARWQDEHLTLARLAPEGDGIDGAGAARLADKLAARFGAERVLRIAAGDTHIPEQASSLRPAHAPRLPALSPAAVTAARPVRLFDPPEPVEIIAEVPDGPPLRLRWRRRSLKIVAAEGPERIAPEWWASELRPGAERQHRETGAEPGGIWRQPPLDATTRDYYRVADETGRQLWLFRAGLYPRADASSQPDPHDTPPATQPRWFVHGLFT